MRFLAVLLLLAAFACAAQAEEAPAVEAPSPEAPVVTEEAASTGVPAAMSADAAAPPSDFISTKNIGDKLAEAKQKRISRFNFGVRDWMQRADEKIYRATRIRFAAIYTALYQQVSTGDGPREAAGGDFDLVGTWDAIRRGGRTTGVLSVALEGRHRLGTDITPSGLSRTIDSLWTTTSGFNVQDFALTQAYWQQDLFNDQLHLSVGKLSGYSTFFGNRINSSSLFFSNYAFADNPAVFFPGNGLGVHAVWDVSPRWSLAAGIQNANGVKTEIDPSTLRYGEFWFAVQAQYRARIRGLGEGTYRVGSWYVMSRQRVDAAAGGGGVLSVDQELGKKLIGFLRYEYQGGSLLSPEVKSKALTGTQSALRGGVCLSGPIKRWPDDFLGIGVAWGGPTDERAKNSTVAEIFYRSQLEGSSQLTLSLQAIRSSTIYDQAFVLGIRFRVEF